MNEKLTCHSIGDDTLEAVSYIALFSVLLSGEFKYVMRPLKEVDEEVHRVQFGVPAGPRCITIAGVIPTNYVLHRTNQIRRSQEFYTGNL